jgi:hypothetical protein
VNRFPIPVVVALILGSFAIADQPPAPPTRANPLIGRWEFLSIGRKKLPETLKLFWTFDERNLVVTDDNGDVISKRQYSIRKDGDHEVISLSGDGKKEPNQLGWYEQKDGKLRIQVTLDTGRPPERWNEDEVMILRPAPNPAPKPARPGGPPVAEGSPAPWAPQSRASLISAAQRLGLRR